MRTEEEMSGLILDVAARDERVRAVCLNGSRANPAAPRDCFQDYDIVYIVTAVEPFLSDPGWVDVFGERVIMQLPDDNQELFPAQGDRRGRYAYLMQFLDGNRIDLTLIPAGQALRYCHEDSETVVWLDKDGMLPALPPASDRDYHVRPPTQAQFDVCCNEFWWVCPYVAKGLWRREIMYSLHHLNGPVRDMLVLMLSWAAGVRTGFTVGTGKCGKYLERFLTADEWGCLMRTYPKGRHDEVWESLWAACGLFDSAAREVAGALGLRHPGRDAEQAMSFLRRVQSHKPGEAPF